ncbi:MAG: hypothetical protein KF830_06770 [Planctomycetes bacterium]|nr:hypothetical protein [Planctomycetota bacterium]
MTARCAEAIEFGTLVDYHTGELGPGEAAFEQHLFTCATCADRLAVLAAIGDAVATVAARGRVFAGVTAAHLAGLEAAGLRLRTYRLQPGSSVLCTIAPEDDANVVRLAADFRGVDGVDLTVAVHQGSATPPTRRCRDLPIDHAAGEAVLLYPGHTIRPLGTATFELELTDARSQRLLGRYTMHHRPWPGAAATS